MRKSTIAVLLSALLMPGAGHLYLKRFWRGIALAGISAVCLGIILNQAMQEASAVVDQLMADGGAIDPAHVSDLVTQASAHSNNSLGTLATLGMAASWVIGIIDSWRLGRKLERDGGS